MALPPEINSGRMYAGPGSGPMMAAAAAWDGLAAELGTAASGYGSVISELTSAPWVGPASTSMVAAVTPYVSWLGAAAGQAEETASQARAAAAAYRDRVHDDGAPAGDRGEPGVVDDADRDQFLRAEHSGDRGHRGPVHGDVGPGRRRHVRLCRLLGDRHGVDPFTRRRKPPPRTDGRPSRRGGPSRRHSRRANAARTARPSPRRSASSHGCPCKRYSSFRRRPYGGHLRRLQNVLAVVGQRWFTFLPRPTPWGSAPAIYTFCKNHGRLTLLRGGTGKLWLLDTAADDVRSLGATAGAGGAWFPTPQFAGLAAPVAGGHPGGLSRRACPRPPRSAGCRCRRAWAGAHRRLEEQAIQAKTVRLPGRIRSRSPRNNGMLQGMPMTRRGRLATRASPTDTASNETYSSDHHPPDDSGQCPVRRFRERRGPVATSPSSGCQLTASSLQNYSVLPALRRPWHVVG